MLSRIAPLGKPLKLTEWRSDMDGKILPAQLQLHEAIVQGRITDVRGRLGPPRSKQRIEELLRDSEFTLLVTPHGTLTIHPSHKRLKFIEKYRIDPDNWVREIDFDQDEGEQACSASLAPCQRQPDRPHLRLVSGTRSGETAAPGSEPAVRKSTSEPGAGERPSVEQFTYAQIAERRGCSPEAARALVKRLNLPRERGSDGKTLVTVNLTEIRYRPQSTRSPPAHHPVTVRSPDDDHPANALPIEPEPRTETVPPPKPAPAPDVSDLAGGEPAPVPPGGDGKTLVAVSPQELLHQPPSARSPGGDRPVNARSPGEPEPELAKAEHTRYQRDRTIAAMKTHYPEDGIRPRGMSIKKLTDRINKLPEFQEGKVSEDTVRLADREIKAALKK